jgi:V8-like Glu-specific endopeptidase
MIEMKLNQLISGVCLSTLLSNIAIAETHDYGEGMPLLAPSVVLQNADGRYNHWTGLGKLKHPKQTAGCSSVLIDTRETSDPPAPDMPAYVLTAGHCAPTFTGSAGSNLKIEGDVQFNYFRGTKHQRKTYQLKRINWSSMQGIDLALIELDASLSEVIADGVHPFRLSRTPLSELPGKEILTLSAPPTSTYFTTRVAACTVDAIADIVEQPYAWRANLRHQCKDMLKGSSGGATLDRYTNEVVGIISTTTQGADYSTRCYTDSPCEVTHGHHAWLAETSYSSPIHMLDACFTNGVFSPQNSACLMKPSSIVTPANPDYLQKYLRLKTKETGEVIPAKWDFAFTIDSTHYAFKTTRTPELCQSPYGYSPSIARKNSHINAQIGNTPGIYTLCIAGVDKHGTMSPASRSNSFIHTVELFADEPVSPPELSIKRTNTGYNVKFSNSLPDSAVHLYKSGPANNVDCEDLKGYEHMYAGLNNLTIPTGPEPMKFCSMKKNAAGELSPPRTDTFPGRDDT